MSAVSADPFSNLIPILIAIVEPVFPTPDDQARVVLHILTKVWKQIPLHRFNQRDYCLSCIDEVYQEVLQSTPTTIVPPLANPLPNFRMEDRRALCRALRHRDLATLETKYRLPLWYALAQVNSIRLRHTAVLLWFADMNEAEVAVFLNSDRVMIRQRMIQVKKEIVQVLACPGTGLTP